MFITSTQALDMLSAHAPRAWCKRLLQWQVFNEGLILYASSGIVIERLPLYRVIEAAKDDEGAESQQLVRSHWGDEVADRITGREKAWDPIEVRRDEWDQELRDVPFGLLIYSETVDLEAGVVETQLTPKHLESFFLEGGEDMLLTHAEGELEIRLSGLSFPLSTIEMLAPGGVAPPSIKDEGIVTLHPRQGGPGRKPKWDWEGAIASVVAAANTPDGLPEGHGAQAEIERMILSYFEKLEGESPCISETRKRATRVMEALARQGRK